MLQNFIPGFKTYLGIALTAGAQILTAMGFGAEGVNDLATGTAADADSVLGGLDAIITSVMTWGGLALAAYGRFVARVETVFDTDIDGDGNIGQPK